MSLFDASGELSTKLTALGTQLASLPLTLRGWLRFRYGSNSEPIQVHGLGSQIPRLPLTLIQRLARVGVVDVLRGGNVDAQI